MDHAEPPFLAGALASRFLDFIRESGASYEEAKCALNAAMSLLQCLPIRLSARLADEGS